MTSRGHIIGRVIDDLSSLTERIEFRAKLGLFDIHRILENFVKDILKIIYSSDDIENLNSIRSNAPGLDLGSNLLKVGFQISSKVNSEKLNSSFEKISNTYTDEYQKIKFIVIGKKQASYTAFNPEIVPDSINFKIENDIIDFRDLSKMIFDLGIQKLIDLNEIFNKEFLIVKYNLVEPSTDTETPITLFHRNDFKPASNGLLFLNGEPDTDEVIDKINREGKLLSNLPLRTRMILLYIMENGKVESTSNSTEFDSKYYLIPKLKREINLPNDEIEEELNILIDERFLGINQMELDIDLHVPETAVYTRFGLWFKSLIAYAIENKCLNKIIVDLDLTVIDDD